MKKLIIFDCDGTLVDSEVIASEVFPAVWSEMGLTMSVDFFLSNFVGTSNDAEIIKSTLAQLPPAAMEIADRKFDEELRKRLQPVRGMKELLNDLALDICVASNSSLGYVNNALSSTGLLPFFGDRVFSSRQVACPKPAPDVFLHAAKTLGYSSENCLVVEDSRAGILAAKNANMKVIGFMGGLHFNQTLKEKLYEAGADFYCSDISQLRKYLLED